ncbi:MAG: winged helix-turn-helix transcriptional regulator [Alphaproteobacteria bacterium]|nr:winged helix-turn-helix transcriptional regulator [Alphaproteobacteria bacterium]
MAASETPKLPVIGSLDAAAEPGVAQPGEQPGFGRNFGFLVNDVSRLIKRRFERRARQTGLPLTRQQAAVVLNIAANEGLSQAEVAAWLGVEPIALVRMLDKLHEQGLVVRRAHPTDRRIRTLWLTAAARAVVTQILAINKTIRDEAFSDMPPQARDTVIHILEHIKNNLVIREEAEDSPAVADMAAEVSDSGATA